ncbi:hypothetical protein MMC10_010795 [Thelotrema lepadinum]|nr:hypothetical protein [Thelotrema lepadinum]
MKLSTLLSLALASLASTTPTLKVDCAKEPLGDMNCANYQSALDDLIAAYQRHDPDILLRINAARKHVSEWLDDWNGAEKKLKAIDMPGPWEKDPDCRDYPLVTIVCADFFPAIMDIVVAHQNEWHNYTRLVQDAAKLKNTWQQTKVELAKFGINTKDIVPNVDGLDGSPFTTWDGTMVNMHDGMWTWNGDHTFD